MRVQLPYYRDKNGKQNFQISVSILLAVLFFFPVKPRAQSFSADQFTVKYKVSHFDQTNGLPQNTVGGAIFDKYGFLWVATEDGLVRFDGSVFKTYQPGSLTQPVSSNRMRGFLKRQNSDTIWAANSLNELFIIANGTFRGSEKYKYSANGFPFLKANTNRLTPAALSHRHADASQMAGSDQYIFSLDENYDMHLLSWYSPKGLAGTFRLPGRPDEKWYIYGDFNGKKVFVANRQRLYEVVLSTAGIKLVPVLDNLEEPGLISMVIVSPGNERIITTSLSDGFRLYQKKDFFTSTTGEKEKQKGTDIFYEQFFLPGDSVLITGKDKLFYKRKYAGRLSVFSAGKGQIFLKDSEGFYWFSQSKSDSLLTLYKSENPGDTKRPVADMQCGVLFEDSKKNVWIGSEFGMGYFKNDHYIDLTSLKRAAVIGTIQIFEESADGSMLIGANNGLYRYDSKAKVKLVCLLNADVRYIKRDSISTDAWICTYGQGFYLLRENGEKITRFPLDRNNYLRNIHCIVQDKNGKMWMPTNNGLFVTTRKSLFDYSTDTSFVPFYFYFDKGNGFLTNEFNGGFYPPYLKHPDGYYTFPSMNGLVWVHPDSVNITFPNGNIFFDEIKEGKNPISGNDKNELTLTKNVTSFSVVLSSPYWGHPDNNLIEYCFLHKNIEPNEKDWRHLSADKKIIISYPQYGSYELIVRQRTGFDENKYAFVKLPVIIPPHWYQTNIFKFLCGVCLVILLFFFLRLRHRYLVWRNFVLQRKISLATRNLRSTNSQLRQSNYIKERLISILSHDISNPLYFISRITNDLIKRDDVKENNFWLDSLEEIKYSTNQLIKLSDNMLTWMQTQEASFKPNIARVALKSFVDDKLEFFAYTARSKNIDFINSIGEKVSVHTDMQLLSIILHNIVGNAVKFTSSGSIEIYYREENDHAIIGIKDTGWGMTKAQLKKIEMNREIRSGIGTQLERGRGLGLKIVRELIEVLKGSLYITSIEESGSTFEIGLPKKLKKIISSR